MPFYNGSNALYLTSFIDRPGYFYVTWKSDTEWFEIKDDLKRMFPSGRYISQEKTWQIELVQYGILLTWAEHWFRPERIFDTVQMPGYTSHGHTNTHSGSGGSTRGSQSNHTRQPPPPPRPPSSPVPKQFDTHAPLLLDAYYTLCVTEQIPDDILNAVHRSWAKRCHPEAGTTTGDADRMAIINAAVTFIKKSREKEKRR